MRAGTVSPAEMVKIRTITDIIRKGRIKKLTETKMIFVNGEEIEIEPDTLFVDCSTNSTLFPCYGAMEPIFQPGRITLNMIQIPQPTNSGGLIAALELLNKDDDFLNSVAKPVNAPQELEDWFSFSQVRNQERKGILAMTAETLLGYRRC